MLGPILTAKCVPYLSGHEPDADVPRGIRLITDMDSPSKAIADSPLDLAELLEMILIHLTLQDLFVLQRVNRS